MLNELAVAAMAELWFALYRRQARALDTPAVRREFIQMPHTLTVNIFDFVRCQAVVATRGVIDIVMSEPPPAGVSRNGR